MAYASDLHAVSDFDLSAVKAAPIPMMAATPTATPGQTPSDSVAQAIDIPHAASTAGESTPIEAPQVAHFPRRTR